MKLVALTTEILEKSLENAYRKHCSDTTSDRFMEGDFAEVDMDEFMEQGSGVDLDEGSNDPAFDIIETVQRETIFVDPEEDDSVLDRAGVVDPELERMADKEDMMHLLAGEGEEADEGKEDMPSTLLGAMSSKGDVWNSLFRFVVRLRSSSGGCDVRWVPNARHVRRASSKLNWHQCLG